MATDNISLGQFNLVGIPPAPRGIPQIDVTFDIDTSGILNVSAKDLGTGKEQKMTITASTKLPDTEVEKMMKQAKEHEEVDKRRKEEVEARNNLDSLIYTTEKTLSEIGDKLSKEQKDKIESALKTAKEAMKDKDIDKMRKETENLQKVLQEAGTAIYQEAAKKYAEEQAKQKTEVGEEETKKETKKTRKRKDEDRVVDAEYKVEDEEK